jgi:outer membrane protein assembly factor BamB
VISGDPPKDTDLAASRLQCLDLAGGKLKWVEKGIAGTVSIADGKLLIMSADGQLIVAEASPAGYKELVRAKVYESNMKGKAMNGRDGAWVMPILVNNRIYCRDLRGATSEIVCLDVGHLDSK